MIHLGDVPAGSTLYIPFATYDSNGASVTMTGLAVTDIEIYKNGSTTQRASDAGYTLLDTDGIDFDGLTGIHGFSIDLSDNTDAGFYAVGSWYWVVVSAVTVDSQTVNFVAAVFRIVAAEGVAGKPKVDVDAFGGSAGTFSGGRPEVNASHAAGTAWNSGAITANTLAADAITAAKVASDVTTELQSGLATAADLSTVAGYIDTEVAAIKAKTDQLTFTGANRVDANLEAIGNDTGYLAAFKRSASTIVRGTVDTGATTTSIPTSSLTPAVTVADQLKGRIVLFSADTTTAALRGQATDITSNTDAGVLTVTALTTAAAAGDTFCIV